MLPIFDINLNIYLFLLSIIASMVVGYWGRSRQLSKKHRRILELEREMVQAHAELLETQREFCELEARVRDTTSPVISMKGNKLDEPQPTPIAERDAIRKNRATGTD